jgi:hypothetical protein
MARGYSKFSSYETGNVISASLFNNDFNKLTAAFTYSSTDPSNTGHIHDGSAENGGAIPKIGDIDFNNKIEIDGTNNLIKLFIEVGGTTSTEILNVSADGLVPVAAGTSLGTVSSPFSTANITTLTAETVNSTDVNASNLTATTAIILEDEALLKFGTSGSEELVLGYAESVSSGIISVGSGEGNLQLNGDEVRLTGGINENYLSANLNSGVELYYDNDKTFETVSGGIDVTGTATMDGLTVNGTTTTDTVLVGHTANGTIETESGASLASSGVAHFTKDNTDNSAAVVVTRVDPTQGADDWIKFQQYLQATDTHQTIGQVQRYNNDGLSISTNTDLHLKATDTLILGAGGLGETLEYDGAVFSPSIASSGEINLGGPTKTFNNAYLSGTLNFHHDSDDAGSQAIFFTNKTGANRYSEIRSSYSSDADGNGTGLTLGTNPNNASTVDRLEIDKDGDITFYEDDGTTAGLFWDASESRVGIGTDSPNDSLHIADAFPKILMQDIDGTNQYGEFYHSNGTTAISARNNTTNGSIQFQRYDGTTAVSSMRIDTSGNVGIGTDSPDAKLHVQGGDIKITSDGDSNSSSDGIPSIIFTEFNDDHATYSADAAHAVISYHGSDVTNEANYLGFGVFNQFTATEDTLAEAKLLTDLNITRDGKVGIGTTEPSAKLHLMAPDCDIDQEMSSDSTARMIEHRFKVDGVMESQLGHYMGIEASEGVDAVDPRFEFRSKHDYWFLGGPTGSAPKVTFKNDGKVGIGTTDPFSDSKLNVDGGDIVVSTSSAINHPSILFYDNDDTQVFQENPINAGIVYNDSATDDKNIYLGLSVWEEYDSSTMTNLWSIYDKKDVTTLNITKGKKVGVNTNTPSAELDVVGKMAVGTSTGIATPESLVSLRLTPAQVANWVAEIMHINQHYETVAGTFINAFHPYFDIFDLDNNNTVGSADAVTPILNSAKTHWTDADQQEYEDYLDGTLTNTSTFIEDVLNGEYDYSVKDVILNAPSSGSIIAKGNISSDGLVVNKKLSHSELLTSSLSVADLHNYVTNAVLASTGTLTVPDKYFNIFDIYRDGDIDSSDVLFISKFIDTDLMFTQAEKDEYDDYIDGTLTNNSTFIQDVFNGSYDYRNKKGVIIDKEAANLVTIEGDVQALSLTASEVDGATATFSQGDFSVLTATSANATTVDATTVDATTVDADTVKTQDIIVYEFQAAAVSPLLTTDRTVEELADLTITALGVVVGMPLLKDYQKSLVDFDGDGDILAADGSAISTFINDSNNNYDAIERSDYNTYINTSPYVYQSTIVQDIQRGDYDYLIAPAKVGINTETPASALDVIGDISVSGNITSDLGLNLTPTNGIEMRAGDANGIEMHWWAQTTGTTVAADGEQTKRFHITDTGVHVGDDVTGTYTAGDLQENQDIDYGFLVGRESDNLGSNNVGIGFELFFDSFTASNFAQGSVLKLHGGAENCVAFGGNLEIGTSASTTVGIKNSFIGGLYAKTNANNTFTWAEGVLDGSTIYAANNNGTGSVLFAKQGQIDSDSEYSLLGGKIGNDPGAGWVEPSLIDSSYAFSWGFGNVVDGSNGAVVCGSFNSADTAPNSLVAGNNNSTLSSNSFVAGLNNSVTNVDTGIAVGKSNTVEGDFSVAMGQDNNTLGVAGVCLGKGLKTPLFLTSSFNYEWDNYSVVVGGYNDPVEKYYTAADNSTWVDDHRFVVGTGTSAFSKDNGFIVAVPTSDFSGVIMPALAASTSHTNDAAAKLAGVPVGGLYHTNGVVKVVL